LLLAVSVAGTGLFTGCGGSNSMPNNIPEPVTYTVNMTASSGTLSHTSTFLFTVTTGIY
jgi:hypothetical protein